MSEYFGFVRQLLALSGETFEEELRQLVSITNRILPSHSYFPYFDHVIVIVNLLTTGFQYCTSYTHGGAGGFTACRTEIGAAFLQRGIHRRVSGATHVARRL